MGLDVVLPVYGLALLDTLSPATIGVTVYVLLTARRRVARMLTTYAVTVAAFYFALGAALLIGLDTALGRFGDHLHSDIAYLIQAGAGVAMFAASWFVPTRRAAEGPAVAAEQRASRAHTMPAMVALGITTGLVEGAMALPYLAAIGIMTTADLAPAQWIPLMAGYNLVMVAPVLVLSLAWWMLGERVRPRMDRIRTWIATRSGEALAWALGILGFMIVGDAVAALEASGGFPFG